MSLRSPLKIARLSFFPGLCCRRQTHLTHLNKLLYKCENSLILCSSLPLTLEVGMTISHQIETCHLFLYFSMTHSSQCLCLAAQVNFATTRLMMFKGFKDHFAALCLLNNVVHCV